MPLFSVVMATRNRPALFGHALESVLGQSCQDIEVIVVNDGSAGEYQSAYEAIIRAADPIRVRCLPLSSRPQGHGGSFARNTGAAQQPPPTSASSTTMIPGPTRTISTAPMP